MQFTIISTIFMAAAAIASPVAAPPAMEPADLVVRTGGGGGGDSKTCSGDTKQVCCNGLLNCVVQILGSQCSGGVYCCDTSSGTGSLINIQALNCVKLL
ncbi:hypothetical protein PG999_004970 [Apiospora kogelbergensis]|uniref:Hydrophobin n=2 Tax=Apiospora kogelbergensis TaxID=1337665 RepID=A0AAW0R0Q7_9PEZI